MNRNLLIFSTLLLLLLLGIKFPHIARNTENWPYIIFPLTLLILIARGHKVQHILPKDVMLASFPWIIAGLAVVIVLQFEQWQQKGYNSPTGQVVEVFADSSQHFHVNALVNSSTTIHFMVDTGATRVVLTKRDAEALGIRLENLVFNQIVSTANGVTTSAPITLESITIEGITIRNVKASISQANLDKSLLGLSFLNRLESYSVSGNKMKFQN